MGCAMSAGLAEAGAAPGEGACAIPLDDAPPGGGAEVELFVEVWPAPEPGGAMAPRFCEEVAPVVQDTGVVVMLAGQTRPGVGLHIEFR